MKRFLITFAITFTLLMFSQMVQAQTGHAVLLTWTASTDATPTSSYNVYLAKVSCGQTPPPPNMALVATVQAVTTYTDPEPIGSYCYYVTALVNGTESVPSNTAQALIRPNAPSGLTAVGK